MNARKQWVNEAATIEVQSDQDDDSSCTLRDAITLLIAQSREGSDCINIGAGLHVHGYNYLCLANKVVGDSVNGVYLSIGPGVTDDSDEADTIESRIFYDNRMNDSGLLPLANNAGTTQTLALRESSSAQNTGSFDNCFDTDRIGQIRNSGNDLCDDSKVEFIPNDDDGFFVIPIGSCRTMVLSL